MECSKKRLDNKTDFCLHVFYAPTETELCNSVIQPEDKYGEKQYYCFRND